MRDVFRVIDFETTGIPTEDDKHAVCEIGWCDVTLTGGSYRVGEVAALLTNPGRPIPVEARSVHHISDNDVKDAATVTAGFQQLMTGMDPASSVFVAHNSDFERAFFGGGDIPWICTYKNALRLWPDAPGHSNQVLRYFLDLDLDQATTMPPHRAGPDAYVTAHILARMLADGAVIEDMIRRSSGPALLPRVNFGKHKNAKWEDVPSDYLEWVAEKSDLGRDAKANARHHLKQRGLLPIPEGYAEQ